MLRFTRSLLVLTVCTFIASPGNSDTVTIGAVGDFGAAWKGETGYSNELSVATLIKSWAPDLILTLGDNNYPEGAAESIDVNIGQFFHEYIHPYVGGYGAGAVSNRFWPSLGNHDWGFPMQTLAGVQPHYDYFTLPGNERYYNIRYGFVELFAVSSDDVEPDGNTVGSIQALWLRDALAASTAQWRIVFFHDSPYSSGRLHGTWTGESEGRKMAEWPFREWGASVVLSAHDHLYERVFANDMAYFICGSGGDRLDDVHYPLVEGSQTNVTQVYGALRLDLTETNLMVRYISVDGVVMDTYIMGEVRIAPTITSHPESQQAPAGGQVVLNVDASGSPPLGYQWFFNDFIPVSDATNATLTLADLQLSQQGDYFAVVSNAFGMATSMVATITVDPLPAIAVHPQGQEAAAGSDVTLSVVANGQPPLSYQWFLNGTDPVSDATNATLFLADVQLDQAGNYTVQVANSFGLATSAIANVRVAGSLPIALDAPQYNWTSDPPWFGQTSQSHDGEHAAQSAPIGDGQLSLLQTVIIGPGLLRFWWKVSSEPDADFLSLSVGGALNSRISGEVDWQEKVVYFPSGFRIVRWDYSKDAGGSGGSDAGWVDQVTFQSGQTVPIITLQPEDQTVPAGAIATFQAEAVGTTPLSYQWYMNGATPMVGSTNATLLLTNVSSGLSGTSFHVAVTNALGSATSEPAQLTVLEPVILTQAYVSNGWFYVTATGLPATGVCVLEATVDFQHWDPIQTNVNPGSSWTFSEPLTAETPARFYRVVVR